MRTEPSEENACDPLQIVAMQNMTPPAPSAAAAQNAADTSKRGLLPLICIHRSSAVDAIDRRALPLVKFL
jgi:hypothetical protein